MLTIQHVEEGLSRAYVQAIASHAGINIGSQLLDYGIDGTFSKIQIVKKRRIESGFKIDFQLKASTRFELEKDSILYDLEAKTFNDLVGRDSRATPLILILLCLPKDSKQWVESNEDSLLLRKACYWTQVTGSQTKNSRTIRVRIPRRQLLTVDSLRKLLEYVEKGEELKDA